MQMNTKITITLNGRIAPNQKFQLGYKFENVGDTLQFIIPTKYQPYNHYLAFQRIPTEEELEEMEEGQTLPTQILPVNFIDGQLVFTISNVITQEAGTYKMIFLSTERKIVDGDIEEAHQVFVSDEFEGFIIDNFLTNPVNPEEQDPNLEVYYEKLDKLYNELEQKDADDFWRGDYFKPSVNEDGYLSWERKEGTAIDEPLPESRNLTGPRGGYYEPLIQEGQLTWTIKQKEDINDMQVPEPTNIDAMVETHTEDYIEEVFDEKVDPKVAVAATNAINTLFRWEWDEANQILRIYTDNLVQGE